MPQTKMIDEEVKKYIDTSVLCWLATVNRQHEPNVSPKEIFAWYDPTTLLIANIASPCSVANIKENPNVCVSFVDVFRQKGYKIKGLATLIREEEVLFAEKLNFLTTLFTDKFRIHTLIEIKTKTIDKIQAPSYRWFPEIDEQTRIATAMNTYKVKPKD
jgi:uncharacterized protein